MMCRKIIFLLLAFCCLLPLSAEDDALASYRESTDKLASTYWKLVKLSERKEKDSEKKKKRKKAQGGIRKLEDFNEKANDAEHILLEAFTEYRIVTEKIQASLEKCGLGKAFSFERYGVQLENAVREQGIDRNYEKDALRMKKFCDPAKTFALLEYELSALQAAEMTRWDTLSPVYREYRTFLNFYTSLDVYRQLTRNFYCVDQETAGLAEEEEIKHRVRMIKQHGASLRALLKKNDPELAEKIDLDGLMKNLELHAKRYAFYAYTTGLMAETASADENRVISAKHKELQTLLQDVMKKYLDPAAEKLRDGAELKLDLKRKDLKQKKSAAKRKRKRKKDEITDPAAMAYLQKFSETQKDMPESSAEEVTAEEDEARPGAAELNKFLKERERFRKEELGLGAMSLLAGGLPEQTAKELSSTMTESVREIFLKNAQKKMEKGFSPSRAYAEAFLAVRSLEKENEYLPDSAELLKIQEFMNQYNQNGESK